MYNRYCFISYLMLHLTTTVSFSYHKLWNKQHYPPIVFLVRLDKKPILDTLKLYSLEIVNDFAKEMTFFSTKDFKTREYSIPKNKDKALTIIDIMENNITTNLKLNSNLKIFFTITLVFTYTNTNEADERTWTSDRWFTKPLLYQLSYVGTIIQKQLLLKIYKKQNLT